MTYSTYLGHIDMISEYKIPKLFTVLSMGFFAITLCLSLLYEKNDLHLTLNQWRHPLADVFFRYTTHLGDGLIFLPAIIYFAWRKQTDRALILTSVALLTLILTAISKSLLFPDIDRPVLAIGADRLNLVEGVRIHSKYSFPSGHTTAAFAFWAALAALIRGRFTGFFALIAITVGISRVYLSQHFISDVSAGCILGISTTAICLQISKYFIHK